MKSLTLLCLLSFAILTAGSLAGRNLLLRRDEVSADPTAEEPTDVTIVFQNSIQTYTQSVETIQKSCQSGDTQTIYTSISTLETSMKTVQEVTHQSNFDANAANTHKESVVQIITSYSLIVTLLSTYETVETGCHKSLQKITSYTQTVVDVYVSYGICLEEEVKGAGSFNEDAFRRLDLELNLKGQVSSTTTQESLSQKPSEASEVEGE